MFESKNANLSKSAHKYGWRLEEFREFFAISSPQNMLHKRFQNFIARCEPP